MAFLFSLLDILLTLASLGFLGWDIYTFWPGVMEFDEKFSMDFYENLCTSSSDPGKGSLADSDWCIQTAGDCKNAQPVLISLDMLPTHMIYQFTYYLTIVNICILAFVIITQLFLCLARHSKDKSCGPAVKAMEERSLIVDFVSFPIIIALIVLSAYYPFNPDDVKSPEFKFKVMTQFSPKNVSNGIIADIDKPQPFNSAELPVIELSSTGNCSTTNDNGTFWKIYSPSPTTEKLTSTQEHFLFGPNITSDTEGKYTHPRSGFWISSVWLRDMAAERLTDEVQGNKDGLLMNVGLPCAAFACTLMAEFIVWLEKKKSGGGKHETEAQEM